MKALPSLVFMVPTHLSWAWLRLALILVRHLSGSGSEKQVWWSKLKYLPSWNLPKDKGNKPTIKTMKKCWSPLIGFIHLKSVGR